MSHPNPFNRYERRASSRVPRHAAFLGAVRRAANRFAALVRSVARGLKQFLESPMPTSTIAQSVVPSAAGGGVAASTGAAIASSPAMWVGVAPDILTLFQLAAVGLLIGIGQGLTIVPPITWRETLGRGMQSMGIALIAGLALHLDPHMNPLVVISCGALLATVGTGGVREILRAKFGVQAHQIEPDSGKEKP